MGLDQGSEELDDRRGDEQRRTSGARWADAAAGKFAKQANNWVTPNARGLEIGETGSENNRYDRTPGLSRTGLQPFAPGPSDPRWPSILRERPDLAPALAYRTPRTGNAQHREREALRDEPGICGAGPEGSDAQTQSPFRGVADGISNLLDGAMSNRTKRLGRLGNAVVPSNGGMDRQANPRIRQGVDQWLN